MEAVREALCQQLLDPRLTAKEVALIEQKLKALKQG